MLKRRFVTCAAASVLFAAAAGVTLGGCADTEGTFYVLSAIPGKAEDGFCIYDPGATPLLDGTFEVLGGAEYTLGLVVRNELSILKDEAKPRVEANHVEIYAVDVELSGVEGSGACPISFTYPSKGSVEPQTDGSTAVLAVPACITSLLVQQMAPNELRTLTVKLVVHGHTTGGDELETPEYEFPIRVGRGAYCGVVEENASFGCGLGVNGIVPQEVCDANEP